MYYKSITYKENIKEKFLLMLFLFPLLKKYIRKKKIMAANSSQIVWVFSL